MIFELNLTEICTKLCRDSKKSAIYFLFFISKPKCIFIGRLTTFIWIPKETKASDQIKEAMHQKTYKWKIMTELSLAPWGLFIEIYPQILYPIELSVPNTRSFKNAILSERPCIAQAWDSSAPDYLVDQAQYHLCIQLVWLDYKTVL